jgi:hypothetical protein
VVKRVLISLALVSLIAVPAMAQITPSSAMSSDVYTSPATRELDPPVFLENTYRNNAGWLNWYPYAGLEFVDDISTIYSPTAKAQTWGTNMDGGYPTFVMTGFDVGWFSIDTNTTHVQTLTVNFYDNPGGADYTGYNVGTVFVPDPPALLASYTIQTPVLGRGAHFTEYALETAITMPTDLWMGVTVALDDTGVMLCKDWSGPNPWYFYNGGAEYGHSDWWWAAGWSWSQYFNGPPVPTTGAPYYDAYSPRGSFTYSIHGVLPEPATLGLLAISGLALIRRRR